MLPLLPLPLPLLLLLLTPILGWITSSASTYRLRRRGLCPAPTLHDPVSQQSDTTRLQPIRLPHASLLLLLLSSSSLSLSSLPTVLSCVCRPALLLIWPISLVHHYHSVHVHRLRPTTRILPWTLGHTLDPPPPAFFLLPSVRLSVCPSVWLSHTSSPSRPRSSIIDKSHHLYIHRYPPLPPHPLRLRLLHEHQPFSLFALTRLTAQPRQMQCTP